MITLGIDTSNYTTSVALFDGKMYNDIVTEAKDSIHRDVTHDITATDIDPYAIEITKENAKRAGVSEFINAYKSDARKLVTD